MIVQKMSREQLNEMMVDGAFAAATLDMSKDVVLRYANELEDETPVEVTLTRNDVAKLTMIASNYAGYLMSTVDVAATEPDIDDIATAIRMAETLLLAKRCADALESSLPESERAGVPQEFLAS